MPISNFLDSYEEYSKNTVAIPQLYNSWCSVMAVSVMLGKRLWISRGHFKIYPNFYIMLIGEPGTGKGIACSLLQSILTEADYQYFSADRSSKEKFLQDLADGINFNTNTVEDLFSATKFGNEDSQPSGEPRECFILAEEFGDFLGQNNFDFIKFLTKVWSHVGPYRYRIKTGRSVTITDPYINLLGGTTSADFSLTFPPEIASQGFLARLILVSGEWVGKRITWPDKPDTTLGTELAYFLRSINTEVRGEISVSPETSTILDKLNQEFKGIDDPRFKDYNNRRFTQLLKLCLVNCAARLDTVLRREDIEKSDALLRNTEHWMPKALGSFGKARNADVTNKILQALFIAERPVQMKELWKLVCDDLDKYQDLGDLLMKLSISDRIQSAGGGWLPKLAQQKKDSKEK